MVVFAGFSENIDRQEIPFILGLGVVTTGVVGLAAGFFPLAGLLYGSYHIWNIVMGYIASRISHRG